MIWICNTGVCNSFREPVSEEKWGNGVADKDLGRLRNRRATIQNQSQIASSCILNLLENDIIDQGWDTRDRELFACKFSVVGCPKHFLPSGWLFFNLGHNTFLNTLPNSSNTNHDCWLQSFDITLTVPGRRICESFHIGIASNRTPVKAEQLKD
ncbi:hypothetical protein OGATHE_005091 [Ogataea polymorpha]|uniref:Uncharacterized protein n=1 Tax=Ogataea polymorpha TaxID=460523 RepID=A0A9P8NWK4_9ASCO|nr:hypothetical protein OGATHE_005091 [Ogataea polymorpha]